MKKISSLSFICLLITVFLDQAGLIIIYPIIPTLLESITHNSVSDNTVIGGWLLASYGIMQFIFAPVMGAISDKFGRKPVLILCFAAFSMDYLLYAFSENLYILFLARIIAGIAGSSIVVSLAGVADMSEPENKTRNYGYIFSMIALGFIIGPLISTMSIHFGQRAPFYVAAIISMIGFLCVVFLFKETLRKDNKRVFKIDSPLWSVLYFLKYKTLSLLFIVHILFMFGMQFPITLWSFFTKYRFEWNDSQIAISFFIMGVVAVFSQTVLLKIFSYFLNDKQITIMGFIFFSLGLICIAFSANNLLIYTSVVLYNLGTISNSTVTSIFSSQVLESKQGQLMGALESITSFCSVLGPVMATNLYYYATNLALPFSDGYPFIFAAIIVFISLIPLYFGLKRIN